MVYVFLTRIPIWCGVDSVVRLCGYLFMRLIVHAFVCAFIRFCVSKFVFVLSFVRASRVWFVYRPFVVGVVKKFIPDRCCSESKN